MYKIHKVYIHRHWTLGGRELVCGVSEGSRCR